MSQTRPARRRDGNSTGSQSFGERALAGAYRQAGRRGVMLTASLLIVLACLGSVRIAAQYPSTLQPQGISQGHGGNRGAGVSSDPMSDIVYQTMSAKQRRYIVHSNFEKSKSDAAELAILAKALRQDLDKSSASLFSPEMIARVDKIEKLAKKIRDETKGF